MVNLNQEKKKVKEVNMKMAYKHLMEIILMIKKMEKEKNIIKKES